MTTIKEIITNFSSKIDALDLELIIAEAIKKPREFVLAHPEFEIPTTNNQRLTTLIKKGIKGIPLAYLLGHKEFYGLDFIVNKDVLIPRPETEILVEQALQAIKKTGNKRQGLTVIDVGTGSGNIIISIIKSITGYGLRVSGCWFFGIDISKKALKVAKKNAKLHKVSGKIKFLHGDLLKPIIQGTRNKRRETKFIILANLPYLSEKIYSSSQTIKYEPKSALLSQSEGLAHYEKLLKQIKKLATCYMFHASCYMEISPEQKTKLTKLIKFYLPREKINFHKDLAGKWRACEIIINNRLA